MKSKPLRKIIYPRIAMVMFLILLIFTLFATFVSRQYIYKQSEDNLKEVLTLVENYIYSQELRDFAQIQESLMDITSYSQTRITIIAKDGTVVLDSDKDPALMNNHADRPEIYKAFNYQENSIIRHSATLNLDLLYYAKLMDRQIMGETHVLRVAMPYTELKLAYRSIYIYIAVWMVIFIILSVMLIVFLRNKLEQPLQQLAETAQQYGALDFSTEYSIISQSLEIQEVSSAMRLMAKKINEQIEDIEQQKAELQVILDGMQESVIVLNNHGEIIDSNPSAQHAFGNGAEQSLHGKFYLQVLRNSELNEIVEDALDTIGSPIQQREIKVEMFGHFYQVHLSRIWVDVEHQNLLMVLNDITTLMHLEQVRKDFVANVSHELKTPVTSIKGFAETLLYSDLANDQEKTKRFIKIIQSQTERLHAIIEDLLTLSRLEQSHNRADDFMPIDMRSIISESVQICMEKPGNEQRDVSVNCDPSLSIMGNSLLIEQTVINLIDNALKYSDEDKPVSVSCTDMETSVKIEVRDQGYGIPQTALDRIFERFYRVDKGRSRDKGGTGLGLSIVKHIVLQHNGTVNVESTEGEGTTFTLLFPKEQNQVI